jgi:hypothetical protein
VQWRGHLTFRAGLLWAMGIVDVAYAVALSLPTNLDTGLGFLAVWMPVGICWLAVSRVGFRRWEILFATAAVTSYTAGSFYYGTVWLLQGSVPFPSPANVMALLFFPLMLAALAFAVRRHMRGLAGSVWLDCAVGSLGAAAALAVVLRPVLDSALAGPRR